MQNSREDFNRQGIVRYRTFVAGCRDHDLVVFDGGVDPFLYVAVVSELELDGLLGDDHGRAAVNVCEVCLRTWESAVGVGNLGSA